nr:DUF2269 family protein [Ferrovum sp.]
MENYLLLKFIHLLGVVIFLGNITVTGWWKFMADRTGDSKIISFAQRQVTLTDYVFTTGGVVLVAIWGYWQRHASSHGLSAYQMDGLGVLAVHRLGHNLGGCAHPCSDPSGQHCPDFRSRKTHPCGILEIGKNLVCFRNPGNPPSREQYLLALADGMRSKG